MATLETRTAGSRLAIVLTTVIVTTVVLAGGVAVATVGFNSVGSPQIKNGSIQSVDIATGGVKTSDIRNGTVNSADIRNGTIRGLDIRDGTITSADIANGTITGADIANGTITGADIANGTITSAKIADGTVTATDLAAAAQPAGVAFADGEQTLSLTAAPQSVRSVVLDAPAPGHVIVTASGSTGFASAGYDSVGCSITDGAIATDIARLIFADDFFVEASFQVIPLSGTRTFVVPAGPTTFRLVCREYSGTVVFDDSQITALYVPAHYGTADILGTS